MAMQARAGSGRKQRTGRTINWLWWAANAAAAWPLVLMIWEYNQGTLGIDIVNAINNRTGRTAIILLMASLACTPLNILFGWRQVLTLRKSLGLWAFFYALLHLLNLEVVAIFNPAGQSEAIQEGAAGLDFGTPPGAETGVLVKDIA